MGEIADMMLDGTLCACCGVAMDDLADGFEAPGYPRYCSKACTPASERKPNKPRRPQEITRSGRGKAPRAFRHSVGSKIVHVVNKATGRSWCKFENNLERGNSAAFGGPPPIVEFDDRAEYSSKKDCKNCAALSARAASSTNGEKHGS